MVYKVQIVGAARTKFKAGIIACHFIDSCISEHKNIGYPGALRIAVRVGTCFKVQDAGENKYQEENTLIKIYGWINNEG